MKKNHMCLSVKLLVGFFIIIILNFSTASAIQKPPPEMESWLKLAKLGPYDTGKENWDEVVKKASGAEKKCRGYCRK